MASPDKPKGVGKGPKEGRGAKGTHRTQAESQGDGGEHAETYEKLKAAGIPDDQIEQAKALGLNPLAYFQLAMEIARLLQEYGPQAVEFVRKLIDAIQSHQEG